MASIVHIKVFDEKKGDVIFEGKVCTDVTPQDLLLLRCFGGRYKKSLRRKDTNDDVTSLEELVKGKETQILVASDVGVLPVHPGAVLYVGAEDGVLRTNLTVPQVECTMMEVWMLSHAECEKIFQHQHHHHVKELSISNSKLREVPQGMMGRMTQLSKLYLYILNDLKSLPEDMALLSSLTELWIDSCGLETIPKEIGPLKGLQMLTLTHLYQLKCISEELGHLTGLKYLCLGFLGVESLPTAIIGFAWYAEA